MPKFRLAALVTAMAAATVPATAHHSDAMFDNTQEKTVQGTVKQFQYTNPHSWIQVMVPGAGGAQAVEWSIETAAPIVLLRAGIKPTSLTPGEKISVKLHPLKDGGPGGSLVEVIKADGTTLSPRGGR